MNMTEILQESDRIQGVAWFLFIFFLAGLAGIQVYKLYHPSTSSPPQSPCLDKVVEIPGFCDHPQHSGSVLAYSPKYLLCICTHGIY